MYFPIKLDIYDIYTTTNEDRLTDIDTFLETGKVSISVNLYFTMLLVVLVLLVPVIGIQNRIGTYG
jgi:hypothetical protein